MAEPYNKFHLSLTNEQNFWTNNIINKWIIIEDVCPNCHNNSLRIMKANKSLCNPVKLIYNKKKIQKNSKYLTKYFFYLF